MLIGCCRAPFVHMILSGAKYKHEAAACLRKQIFTTYFVFCVLFRPSFCYLFFLFFCSCFFFHYNFVFFYYVCPLSFTDPPLYWWASGGPKCDSFEGRGETNQIFALFFLSNFIFHFKTDVHTVTTSANLCHLACLCTSKNEATLAQLHWYRTHSSMDCQDAVHRVEGCLLVVHGCMFS